MSLFKTRDWWSTLVGQGEEFDTGCLCVADIDNKGSDKIIVGSYHGFIRIYQPVFTRSDGEVKGAGGPDDVICEVQLSLPVLQLAAGRFVSSSDNIYLGVLHPRKFTVYTLLAQPGIADHGKQFQLNRVYEHKLQRTAFNFCYGPFGGVKAKDFVCVQSMDGAISIFEQESFAFSRFLPSSLLPGPIKYIAYTDSFITASSCLQVESYKFQVVATATDEKSKQESQNITKGKRITADWTFLLNETALDLVVANFQNSPLTIFVLGERNLYALTEAGCLSYMVKFDFNPSCFLPFSAGRSESISCMISTYAKTLLLYQNTCLKWAAQMPTVPVQIVVTNFNDMKGTIVAIDEEGHLTCFYLGTDPSMFLRPTSELREVDYSSAETEMQQLQRAIKEQQNKSILPMPSASGSQEDLKLSIFVPPSFDQPSMARESKVEDSVPVPSITVTVSMQAKTNLRNIRLRVSVVCPLVVSETLLPISVVEPGRPVEKKVTIFMKHSVLPTDLRVEATAVFYTNSDAPRVVYASGHLPFLLVMRPCLPVRNAGYKLTIDTNKPPVNLTDIFPEVTVDGTENSNNAFGFKYYGLDPVITVLASKSSQRYRIQCDEFAYMWHVLNEFVRRLSSHFKAGHGSDFLVFFEGAPPLHEYYEVIDRHFECRAKHSQLAKVLEERASQFRAVQKRLLVMYRDKTPAPLNGLDVLLDNSYKQVLSLASAVDENQEKKDRTSAELSCTTRIVCLLLKLRSSGMSHEDYVILESCLTSVVNDNYLQGWEEVVDASITHLLRTAFSTKNAKDVVLNPGPLALQQDTEKLKKHIAVLCDRLSKGAQLSEEGSKSQDKREKTRLTSIKSEEDFEGSSSYPSHLMGGMKKETLSEDPESSEESFYESDSKKPLRMSGGKPFDLEPVSHESPEHSSGQRFIKKSAKEDETFNDRVPDLDDLVGNKNSEQLKSGQEELIYGI